MASLLQLSVADIVAILKKKIKMGRKNNSFNIF